MTSIDLKRLFFPERKSFKKFGLKFLSGANKSDLIRKPSIASKPITSFFRLLDDKDPNDLKTICSPRTSCRTGFGRTITVLSRSRFNCSLADSRRFSSLVSTTDCFSSSLLQFGHVSDFLTRLSKPNFNTLDVKDTSAKCFCNFISHDNWIYTNWTNGFLKFHKVSLSNYFQV